MSEFISIGRHAVRLSSTNGRLSHIRRKIVDVISLRGLTIALAGTITLPTCNIIHAIVQKLWVVSSIGHEGERVVSRASVR